MKKILGFGDVHFSAINKWNISAGNNFINWFEAQDFGDREDVESVWAGDIGERDTSPGIVIDQINRLFTACRKKFKHTYIIVGNHDKKLYHDVLQHTLMFLDAYEEITVINSPKSLITENGFSLLGLPHLHVSETGALSLNDYYSWLLSTSQLLPLKGDKFDVCCGHWNIEEGEGHGFASEGVDITPLQDKVNCWMLGHIHTRPRKEYLGSIWPNKYDEQDSKYKRCYKEFNSNGQTIEMPLPEFLHYSTIKLGDEIPQEQPNCEYVYCISNCSSELVAKEKYPNINIRAIEKKAKVDFSDVKSEKEIDAFTMSYSDAFTAMRNEMNIPMSRGAVGIIRSLLKEKDGQC